MNNQGAYAMTKAELLKVIEEAKASGVTELDLRKKGITALPQEICQLTKLETLRLDGIAFHFLNCNRAPGKVQVFCG